MKRTSELAWIVVVGMGLLMAAGGRAFAQGNSNTVSPTTAPAAKSGAATFKLEELEQIAAPIALYPDAIMSQVLMASTYPIEIVQADRWVKANATLKGDALTKALEKQTWDPSVKSLVNFPQVLAMMSEKLDWTTKLGDAFIGQQAALMNAVQRLRSKAQAAGNLKTTKEQTVIVEPAPPATVIVEQPATQIIRIESPSPTVVYVPAYNPTVVYGAWPYPYYPPPAPYYPPGYVASNMISFGMGVAVGAAWGYAWGGCNWGHGDVDIDVNRNTNINNNINRESYKNNMQNNAGGRQGTAGAQSGQGKFQHDPAHRGGVSYRDQSTAQKYNRSSASDAAKARESYRGRDTSGSLGGSSGAARPSAGSLGGSTGARPEARPSAGSSGAANRASPSSSNRSSAFEGSRNSGSATHAQSNRGASSRQTPTRSSAGSSRSSGGGGSRGGGRR